MFDYLRVDDFIKDMVAALFEILSNHHATKLAKGPARQFQVLNCHIRKKP